MSEGKVPMKQLWMRERPYEGSTSRSFKCKVMATYVLPRSVFASDFLLFFFCR